MPSLFIEIPVAEFTDPDLTLVELFDTARRVVASSVLQGLGTERITVHVPADMLLRAQATLMTTRHIDPAPFTAPRPVDAPLSVLQYMARQLHLRVDQFKPYHRSIDIVAPTEETDT